MDGRRPPPPAASRATLGRTWRRRPRARANATPATASTGSPTPADEDHVKVQWLWDIRYIDAPVLAWRNENDDGDVLEANETLYYCQDATFNVTALVNASGTVVERYVYDPYGKVTISAR